jgi:hypothetical protein
LAILNLSLCRTVNYALNLLIYHFEIENREHIDCGADHKIVHYSVSKDKRMQRKRPWEKIDEFVFCNHTFTLNLEVDQSYGHSIVPPSLCSTIVHVYYHQQHPENDKT